MENEVVQIDVSLLDGCFAETDCTACSTLVDGTECATDIFPGRHAHRDQTGVSALPLGQCPVPLSTS
jgi:hypothetical protein